MSDWLPTLLEITGNTNPEPAQWDGKSVWTYLQNPQAKPATARSFYWKIKGASAVRDGDWKLIVRDNRQTELYNLKTDFRENRDLSNEHPGIIKAMLASLEAYKKGDRD